MPLLLTVIGAVVGLLLAEGSVGLAGLVGGATLGYLLGRQQRAEQRLRQLEDDARLADRLPAAAPPPAPQPAPAARAESPPAPPPAARAASRGAQPATRTARQRRAAPAAPDLLADAFGKAQRWLTTGNVPVKIGVIISFFGVAFLLKYAVDNRLVVFPIEWRLLTVAAAASGVLAVGWRLRESKPVYALSLQGGGIGVLYLTIFAALRLYELLPATLAFLLLVALTVAVGVLAVVQNARSLAVFAVVGGFLAPVLTSTGQGSHVALFSYYLLLNLAILGISWHRAWRSLNLIGFAFTFGIGTAWGFRYYRPEYFASTEPFLVLHFLLYQAIAVLFAFRQRPRLRGVVDGSILFGTPVIAFALQSQLVADSEYGLAISAAAVGVFYVLLASWLWRRQPETLRLMVESYLALAVAFATIAIPLALDARWTAAAWALEGAALVWVGVRQQGRLARAAGVLLLVASGIAFAEGGWRPGAGIAVLNGNFLGGLLIAGAAFHAAWLLFRDAAPMRGQPLVSVLLLLWSLAWWLGAGAREAADRLGDPAALNALVVYAALSAAALAHAAPRLRWPVLTYATLGWLPLAAALGAMTFAIEGHLLSDLGWAGWPLAVAALWYVLRLADDAGIADLGPWHAAGFVLVVAALATELGWRVDAAGLGTTWSGAAAFAAVLLCAAAVPRLKLSLPWPVARYWLHFLGTAGLLLAASLALLILGGLENGADPAPLPYLPLLNPADALSLLGLLLAAGYLQRHGDEVLDDPQRRRAWHGVAAAAFLLSTIAVVRAVHHYAAVPWDMQRLADSVSVQAALSIFWGLLGFTGMIAGARRAQRTLWLLGTGMMALVVVKLFLIDLGNTGTVARIVSFLGVGALLLVVGYFAPAPPKRDAADREGETS